MAKILVIDDEEAVRNILGRLLERAGHEVLYADDGAAGMTLLAEQGAHVVITDIFMPGQDGLVTLRRLRKEFPQVKVITISGGDLAGWLDLHKGAELLGAARSLEKPVRAAELVQAVQEVLDAGSSGTP